jgi:DNA-binding GntR family transcriptional regulator
MRGLSNLLDALADAKPHTEVALATRLGVTATAVRQAVRRLMNMGIAVQVQRQNNETDTQETRHARRQADD